MSMAPGVCDVIATPLFATFDRSSKVRFTAPLFFSNIGLYMNKDAMSRTFLEGISVQNLTERLRDGGHTSKDLQFLSIKGEISEKMAMKYAGWMVDDRVGQFVNFRPVERGRQRRTAFARPVLRELYRGLK